MSDKQVRPYDGLRVIDLTRDLGSYTTRLFADLGADVIRIERAKHGAGATAKAHEEAADVANFAFFNVDKRGVALDFESEAGQARLRDLVASAQVVVYDADASRQSMIEFLTSIPGPRVVTVVSYFGLTGPYANYVGCDLVAQALGGIAWLSGRADRPPLRLAGEQSWIVASVYAAVATAAALWDVEMRGARHLIDVSAQEAIAHSLQNTVQMFDIVGRITKRGGGSRDAMEGIFACRDGYVFLAAPSYMDDQWNQITIWMEETGFDGFRPLRNSDWSKRDVRTNGTLHGAFKAIFERFLADKSRADVAREAMRRKILIAPVNTVADLPDDPQLLHRAFFTKVWDPMFDCEILYPGPPYKMSEPVWAITRPAPWRPDDQTGGNK
jgi:benzylsuccinate CoA-transferase BbsE subunit